jgi:hypothetical protein
MRVNVLGCFGTADVKHPRWAIDPAQLITLNAPRLLWYSLCVLCEKLSCFDAESGCVCSRRIETPNEQTCQLICPRSSQRTKQRSTDPLSLKPRLQHCLGRGHCNVRASNLNIRFFFESLSWHSFNYATWRHLLGVGYRKRDHAEI